MTKKATNEKPLGVLDLETDPFLYGRTPLPFLMGFKNADRFVRIWDDDPQRLVERTVKFFDTLEPHLIYAHNGGKFDWFYFLSHITGEKLKLIGGRIAQAHIGRHEIRDSFSILPVPLRSFDKGDIDYHKLEREVRGDHEQEIIDYLRRDCESLFALVSEFHTRFGRGLTIAGTALKEIKKHHRVVKCGKHHDEVFRPFYFGGRVECFQRGIVKMPLVAYDVNSMYPAVMKNAAHPVGSSYLTSTGPLTASGKYSMKKAAPFFIRFIGRNYGALPMRTPDGLRFDVERGEFATTSHELVAALETNSIVIEKILHVHVPNEWQDFAEFVDMCIEGKLRAEAEGDKAGRLFFKLLANSGYGKFGSNPEHYKDYMLNGSPGERVASGYSVHSMIGDLYIWERAAKNPIYYDVAIAASITGAARAQMLRGIHQATDPVYCDTDSIICRAFAGETHATKLGAWKLEATGDRIAVAGKKMYSLWDGAECVKKASKGVRLSPDEIHRIASGDILKSNIDPPSYSLRNSIPDLSGERQARFVSRNVRAT